MKQNQLESRAYVKPAVTINPVDAESLLSTGSHFSGGHNQGHVGGGGGDAKQGWFEEEEEDDLNPEEERSHQLWNE